MKTIRLIKLFFITLIIMFLYNNCKNNFINEKSFNRMILDNGVDIKINKYFKLPHLYLFNKYLIIHDPYTTANMINIFSRDNYKLIKSFGIIGRGEYEFTAPGPLNVDPYKNNILWASDWGKFYFYKYCIDSIINNNFKYIFKYKFPLPPSYEFQIFNVENSFLCMSYNLPYLFKVLKDNQIKDFFNISFLIKKVGNSNPQVYMPTFIYHPIRRQIFIAFRYIDVIMAIDTSENIIFYKECFDRNGINKKIKQFNERTITTFSNIKIFNDKIFVMYTGKSEFNEKRKYNFPDKILIFNINGDPLKLIQLNQNISDYVYDEKNKRLVVFSLEKENSFIYFDFNL